MFTIFEPLHLTFHDHNYKPIFLFFKSFWIVPRLTSLWRLLKYSINWRAECSFKINRGLYIPSTIAFSIAHAIMYTEIWIFDILYKVSNCFRPNKKTNRRRRNSMKLFFSWTLMGTYKKCILMINSSLSHARFWRNVMLLILKIIAAALILQKSNAIFSNIKQASTEYLCLYLWNEIIHSKNV